MILAAIADGKQKANLQHLHEGDRIVFLTLDLKGVIETMNYNEATVIVTDTDGFPVKLEDIKLNLLRKY